MTEHLSETAGLTHPSNHYAFEELRQLEEGVTPAVQVAGRL